MSSRSLNKVTLIGNLTRDPELRYTPQGTAVCTFSLATNRQWVMESGEKREDTEFHRIVSWNKLAELCNQLLAKGKKVYVEGRLQTRTWTGQDGRERTTTEIVIDDMILLDSRRMYEESGTTGSQPVASPVVSPAAPASQNVAAVPVSEVKNEALASPAMVSDSKKKKTKADDQEAEPKEGKPKGTEISQPAKVTEEINPDDIPF